MSKVLNLLTVCCKAGKLKQGFDASKEAIEGNKAFLIILSSDISPKTEKEIRFFAGKTGVSVIKAGIKMEEFYSGFGKKTAVMAICDGGFSRRLTELLA